MTTVFSFPFELLAEIFCIAVQKPVLFLSPKSILAMSHVCRYWRTVCLETPQFRSGIVVYGCNRCNRYATIFLERCKGTPIDLYASPNVHHIRHTDFPLSDIGSDISSLITPHTDQIRSITILGECPLLEFVTSLKQASPLLRSVRMNVRELSDQPLLWEPPIVDQTVTIHTVDLAGIAIPLDLPVFRDMVHLGIELDSPTQDPPTIESLLAIWASSPRMRVLRLLHFGPYTSQQLLLSWPPSQIIRLEHLEHLNLRGTIHNVTCLFSYLSIAFTTIINIGVSLEHISNLSFLSILPRIYFDKVSVNFIIPFLSSKELGHFQTCQFQGVEIACTIYGGWYTSASAPLKCLHDIFDLIPTPSPSSNVELCFDDISVTDQEWVGIITRPPICNVKSLLAYSYNQSFFVALASRKPPETPYLPNLETLYLPPVQSEVTTYYIQNYLEARTSAGIRLKKIKAHEWIAELPEFRVLLSLADSFHWLPLFLDVPLQSLMRL